MKIIGGIAKANFGIIHFKDLKVVGKHTLKFVDLNSRGKPSPPENHNPYSVSINCKVGEQNTFSSIIHKKITVGLCSPGRQPDGKEVCNACSANTYGLSGLSCLPCPAGAQCTQTISLQGVKVQVGSIDVSIEPGYWHDDMPGKVQDQCVQDVLEAWRNSSCPPGKYYTQKKPKR